MQNIRILTAGDSSILIEFGKEISPEINRKISATIQLMKEQHIEGVVDMIPAFCSLLINYDPRVISYDEIRERMQALVKVEVKAGETRKRIFEIPVCYGGEYGPDIANIAEHARSDRGRGYSHSFLKGLSDLYVGISSGLYLSGRSG